jgi:hypothetical protein
MYARKQRLLLCVLCGFTYTVLVRRWRERKSTENMFHEFHPSSATTPIMATSLSVSPGLSSLCVAGRGFADISQSGRKSNHY